MVISIMYDCRELKHYYSWFINFDLVEGIIEEFCKEDDDVNESFPNMKNL